MNNAKILGKAIVAISIGLSVPMLNVNEAKAETSQSNKARQVSIQKLYVNEIDASTGKSLGKTLVSIEHGYTDSPHKMFSVNSYPKIAGYHFEGNPPGMIPVDWKNPSGVTTIEVVYTPNGYKRSSASSHKNRQNALNNADGNNIHELYHLYRAYIGKPLGPDRALTEAEKEKISPSIKRQMEQFGPLDDKNNTSQSERIRTKPKKQRKKQSNKSKKNIKNKKQRKKQSNKSKKNKKSSDVGFFTLIGLGIAMALGLISYGVIHLRH